MCRLLIVCCVSVGCFVLRVVYCALSVVAVAWSLMASGCYVLIAVVCDLSLHVDCCAVLFVVCC